MNVINSNEKILEYISDKESIIKHKKARCFQTDGKEPVIKGQKGSVKDSIFLNVLTEEPPLSDHIDIMLEKPFVLEYDLSDEPVEIDCIVFMGFGTGDYDIKKFDVYASTGKNTLSDENLICRYNCKQETVPGARNTCDVMIELDKPVTATKIAIKISEPNKTDNCMRISFIGVYSDRYDNTVGFLKKLGKNLITAKNICLPPAEAEKLCNNMAYDKDCKILSNGEIRICTENIANHGIFRVYYKGSAKLFVNGKRLEAFEISKDNLCVEYVLKNEKSIALRSEGTAYIYETALYETQIPIEVSNKSICEDFHGIGACVLPMSFMDNSISQGFNKAYWEKEKSRVNLCRPAVVRLWFQPDWFIIDKETYYNHKYDFDSEKMKAVYPYLDLFKESDIEVEMNYGWKVDDRITAWYSIPGVPRARESAPADLDEFAYSCAEFMNELITKRGYTNIKYLTFYNEPGGRYVYSPHYTGDFHVGPPIYEKVKENEIPQEQFEYWYKMLCKACNAISKKGLSKRLKIWGPEYAIDSKVRAGLWLKGFTDDDPCMLDVFTIHRYDEIDSEIRNIAAHFRSISNIPLCATEFAVNGKGSTWEISNTQMAITFINNGWSGALLWLLSGTALASPLNFNIDGDDVNMWRYLPLKPQGVNSVFYELCLFMRYIPAHSKVLEITMPKPKTEKMFRAQEKGWVQIEEPTVRAAALVTPNGDYVVIVQTPQSDLPKEIKVKLPITEEKKFNKISVGRCNNLNAPAKLPVCTETVKTVGGILADEAGKDYTLTFYTTEKPYPQIICDSDIYYMHRCESRSVLYSVFNSESNTVTMSITEGEDLIRLDNGTVTVNETAESGGMAVVTLRINDISESSYFVLLIKVL